MISAKMLGLGPSDSWAGLTLALSPTGQVLGDATSYPAGTLITNLDAAITVYLSATLAGLASAATRIELIPGINPSVVLPIASRALAFAKSASGTPSINVVSA